MSKLELGSRAFFAVVGRLGAEVEANAAEKLAASALTDGAIASLAKTATKEVNGLTTANVQQAISKTGLNEIEIVASKIAANPTFFENARLLNSAELKEAISTGKTIRLGPYDESASFWNSLRNSLNKGESISQEFGSTIAGRQTAMSSTDIGVISLKSGELIPILHKSTTPWRAANEVRAFHAGELMPFTNHSPATALQRPGVVVQQYAGPSMEAPIRRLDDELLAFGKKWDHRQNLKIATDYVKHMKDVDERWVGQLVQAQTQRMILGDFNSGLNNFSRMLTITPNGLRTLASNREMHQAFESIAKPLSPQIPSLRELTFSETMMSRLRDVSGFMRSNAGEKAFKNLGISAEEFQYMQARTNWLIKEKQFGPIR